MTGDPSGIAVSLCDKIVARPFPNGYLPSGATVTKKSLSFKPNTLVELAGAGGVGKTTAAPMLALRLRKSIGAENIAALPEKDLPRKQRHWRHMQRRAWILSHPAGVLAAWRVSRAEPRIARFSTWLDLFTTHGIARRMLDRNIGAVLIDQGFLRLSLTTAHVPLLPAELLPGLVIQLVADPAVLEVRRIQRPKIKRKLFEGPARMEAAMRSARLLGSRPQNNLPELLEQFGKKFCLPPLNATEIGQVLQACSDSSIMGSLPTPEFMRCHPGVLHSLQQRGVRIVQVENSGEDGLEPVVEQCLEIILNHLARA